MQRTIAYLAIILLPAIFASTLHVPGDYTALQDAILAANGSDVVVVSNVTLNELVIVNKSLVIQALNSGIDCLGSGTALSITAGNVSVFGLRISNCTTGIEITKSNVNISHTILSQNSLGMQLTGNKISVTNNVIANNSVGGHIINGSQITVMHNDIYGNSMGLMADVPLVAQYNWWGACDGPSPPGSGDTLNGSITVEPFTGACQSNLTETPACIVSTTNVSIMADINGSCIGNVTFFADFGAGFHALPGVQIDGNTFSTIVDSINFSSGQTIFWYVVVDDCFSHISTAAPESFYVNSGTDLSVLPLSPDGLNGWYVTEPVFTLLNLDAGLVKYQWDSDTIFNYSGPFGLEDIPNPPPQSAGILDLHFWSDVCSEEEQTVLFNIDLTNPQFKDYVPIPHSSNNNPTPLISIYIDEVYHSNSGVDNSSIVLEVDGIAVDPMVKVHGIDRRLEYIPALLSDGIHTVFVSVNDRAGRQNSTSWNFTVNGTYGLDLELFAPVATTYGSKKIPFNVSIGEASLLEYIDHNERIPRWRRLCTKCLNYGTTLLKTKAFTEGRHNVSIRATNAFGAVDTATVQFFIDSIPPRIIRTLPKKNSYTNGSDFYVRFTEDNLVQVNISFNPTIVLSDCIVPGSNKDCYIDLNLSEFDGQEIEYWFTVRDLVRHFESKLTKIRVDTTYPQLSVSSPVDMVYGNRVPFAINASEEIELDYIDSNDDNPRWRRLCSACESYVKERSFKSGSHDVTIRARDKAGNTQKYRTEFTVI